MPSVSVGEGVVHYQIEGEGPGLVLVHGTGGSADANFAHLVARFADVRTVIRPDYSGSGATTDGGGELTVESLAAQVAAASRDAAGGPVDVLGFSLGAVVAAATAAIHPELVRRLILVAGWTHGDDARHRLTFELWRDLNAADPELFGRFAMLTGFSPGYLSGLGHEGLAAALAMGEMAHGIARQIELDLVADIRPLLGKITTPTLVVGLTQDQMVPVEGSRQLQAAIAGSRYVEIDSGHVVVYEQPDELVSLVREFVLG